ncbi:MAG TPA: hypothetical protein VE573_05310 [Nitrososphaeraceae archaeon]|nr:hypothetical protein [Nitrososphaeraceae archaeon]
MANINGKLEDIDFRRFDIVTIDILYIIIQPSSFIGQETTFNIVSTAMKIMKLLLTITANKKKMQIG